MKKVTLKIGYSLGRPSQATCQCGEVLKVVASNGAVEATPHLTERHGFAAGRNVEFHVTADVICPRATWIEAVQR